MEDNSVEINGSIVFSSASYRVEIDVPQDGFSKQHSQERRGETKVDRARRIRLDPQVRRLPPFITISSFLYRFAGSTP